VTSESGSGSESGPASGSGSASAHDIRDALIAFALASIGVAALAALGRAVPLVHENLGALVAVVFLYLPFWYAGRRSEDLSHYGFRADPLGKGLALGFGAPLLIFPLFAVLFVLFYAEVCQAGQPMWLRQMAPPGTCDGFRGWDGLRAPIVDRDFLTLVAVQVIVIALPEELFFRGFLHELFERALPPRRRLFGGGIGWALILSSLLFALGHLASGFDARRLSVFFPGLLFGWMRSATGSILAGTIAHAASNLFIHLLEQMFL
jgi:hypothetical protein